MPFSSEDRKHVLYLRIPLHRVGECDSCLGTYKQAYCCSDLSMIEFTTDVLADDVANFLTVKGVSVDGNKRAHFSVRRNCDQYNWETRKCKIWPTRPNICRKFPVHFEQMYETVDGKRTKLCSYDWDYDTSNDIEVDLFSMTEVLKLE